MLGCAGSLAGICISLAVTMPSCGTSEFPPELMADHGDIEISRRLGASWIEWMIRAVARNRATTIKTGMTVQASSI